MRFHKVFDHIVAYNQQRNEAINNDLIFSNLSFFLGKTSFDDLYKLPHRSKITQMVVDVMGLKIDEIMGYNGLATKKNSSFTSFWKSFVCQRSESFWLFFGREDHKHQTEKLFDRFLFSTLQYFVKVFLKSILIFKVKKI